MDSKGRFLGYVAVLLVFQPPGSAYADMYTGGVLSLEWLVDSSDEVYLVGIVADPAAPADLTVRAEKALKSGSSASGLDAATRPNDRAVDEWLTPANKERSIQFLRESSGHWKIPSNAKAGDQWLLFVRSAKAGPPSIVRVVNLTRPREHSWTAAITGSGVPLTGRRSILDAVERRIGLKRRLPAGCNRELIDRCADDPRAIVKWMHESPGGVRPLDPRKVEAVLGGFAVPINCGYWDGPTGDGDADEDLLLLQAVVPADPEYLGVLLEHVTRKEPGNSLQTGLLYALLNYPGEKTETVLEKIGSDPSYRRSFAVRHVRSCLKYRDGLTDLSKYREGLTDPLNRALVGRWRLEGSSELIELTLEADNTCTINVTRRSTSVTDYGKGHWAVREGRLWILRTHLKRQDRWVEHIRAFFKPKLIKKVTSTDVVLEGGPPMKRR